MDRFRDCLNSRPRLGLPSEEVRAQLDRVLGSQTFGSAPSLSRFLAHVVEQTLNGKQDSLKEYSLGVDVFDRGDSFDPKTDTIVRSQARRLRLKLREYYEGPGCGDLVLIGLGKGRYVPEFSVVQPATADVAGRDRPRYIVAALLVLTVPAGGGLRLARVADPTAPSPAEAMSARWSLAVLPFQTLSSGDDEYLGIGMADSLITRLGLLGSISVRPLAGVRFYADGKKDPQTAGRELRVQSVLDGSLQRDGDRLRVRVRLYRVADGTLLWAEQFDQQARDIFAVQDSISEKVASALSVGFAAKPQL
jgi:TolB-like protein